MLARRACDFKRFEETANERLARMICSSLERTDALVELQFLMNASRLITIPSGTTDLDSDKTAIPIFSLQRQLRPSGKYFQSINLSYLTYLTSRHNHTVACAPYPNFPTTL